MNRKEMEEKRNDLVTRSVEILNTAEAEERALTEEEAKGSLRLTVGPENTEEEIDEAVRIIRETTEDLRRLFRG